MKLKFSVERFSKNIKISNFMKILLVIIALFHAERRTDMTKLIVAFRNFSNALKKKTLTVNLISLFRPASLCSNTELTGNTKLNDLFLNLTFMGPCIVRLFQCTSNKMQRYTVFLYLKTALHVSAGKTTHHQERMQLYLQHLVFVTPLLLSAAIVHSTLKPVPTLPREWQVAAKV